MATTHASGPWLLAGSVTTMITEHVTSALLELSEQTLERGSPMVHDSGEASWRDG